MENYTRHFANERFDLFNIYIYVYVSIYVSTYIYVYIHRHISNILHYDILNNGHLNLLQIDLSIYLFIYLIYLFIHLSLYLSLHIYIIDPTLRQVRANIFKYTAALQILSDSFRLFCSKCFGSLCLFFFKKIIFIRSDKGYFELRRNRFTAAINVIGYWRYEATRKVEYTLYCRLSSCGSEPPGTYIIPSPTFSYRCHINLLIFFTVPLCRGKLLRIHSLSHTFLSLLRKRSFRKPSFTLLLLIH